MSGSPSRNGFLGGANSYSNTTTSLESHFQSGSLYFYKFEPIYSKFGVYNGEIVVSFQTLVKGKGKGKVLPITGHEEPEGEQMYSSTLPSTSALDRVGVQHHALADLPLEMTRYPLYRRLSGPQVRSGRVRKISAPP